MTESSDHCPSTQPHHLGEDIAAGLTGTSVLALGLTLMAKAGLITGGVPGLALLISYSFHVELWILLLIINVPFLALALLQMGWKLSLRTAIAMVLLSLLIKFTPGWAGFENAELIYAALVGGALLGLGMLILFRHRTTVGGFGILALYLQDRFGWRAGYVQMSLDSMILLASLLVIPSSRVAISLLGAAVLNFVLAANHRPGRYRGMS